MYLSDCSVAGDGCYTIYIFGLPVPGSSYTNPLGPFRAVSVVHLASGGVSVYSHWLLWDYIRYPPGAGQVPALAVRCISAGVARHWKAAPSVVHLAGNAAFRPRWALGYAGVVPESRPFHRAPPSCRALTGPPARRRCGRRVGRALGAFTVLLPGYPCREAQAWPGSSPGILQPHRSGGLAASQVAEIR